MLGNMISKIRKDKNITKVELSKRTKINIGHITHIEKGERNPSHKTLRTICDALEVPYQNLMYLYDKEFFKNFEKSKMMNHLSYNKILAVDNFSSFVECPDNIKNASIAVKVQDDAMSPYLKKNSYAYIELNSPLKDKDVGLFEFNNNFIIRRFIVRKDLLTLKAENKKYEDIYLSADDDFTVVGKVLN